MEHGAQCYDFDFNIHRDWLGFDKFKNVVYGIQSSAELDLVALSVHSCKIKMIKRLHLPNVFDNGDIISRTWSISSCGCYIALIYYPAFFRPPNEKTGMFHLFSIETGEIESSYRLLFPSSEDWYLCKFTVYHSSMLGWIIDVAMEKEEVCKHLLLKITFDEFQKTCTMEQMTRWMREVQNYNKRPPLFCQDKLMLFTLSFNNSSVEIFDCISKTWSVMKLSNLPNLIESDYYLYKYIISSESGQNLIAIPYYYIPQNYSFFKLVDADWERLNANAKYDLKTPISSSYISYACCTSDSILIQAGPTKSILYLTFDVAQLKSLAMRRIFANCKHMNEKQIIDFLDLPILFKRQYFGPSWSWDEALTKEVRISYKTITKL